MNAAPSHRPSRKHLARRRRQRGQAMLEYSVLNYVLLMGLLFATTAPVFKTTAPDGDIENRNVIEMMLEAYQHYYDSFYLVLSAPFP